MALRASGWCWPWRRNGTSARACGTCSRPPPCWGGVPVVALGLSPQQIAALPEGVLGLTATGSAGSWRPGILGPVPGQPHHGGQHAHGEFGGIGLRHAGGGVCHRRLPGGGGPDLRPGGAPGEPGGLGPGHPGAGVKQEAMAGPAWPGCRFDSEEPIKIPGPVQGALPMNLLFATLLYPLKPWNR